MDPQQGQEVLWPSAAAGRSASLWSRTHVWSSRASQARFGSRGLSRARSETTVEETWFLLEVVWLSLRTQWDFLPSSCTVYRLISKTVGHGKAKTAAGLDVL